MGLCESEHSEKSMIAKLKTESVAALRQSINAHMMRYNCYVFGFSYLISLHECSCFLPSRCGYQWTNKLEGMFKDVQLSKDLMTNFKKMFDAETSVEISLDVNVCTTGYWSVRCIRT